MKSLKLATILVFLGMAQAALAASSLDQDFDSLGGNRELLKRARALDPEQKLRVVQKREVDRHLRLEAGVNYGLVSGGDPYTSTNNLGANLDFHITPRWSIGARYYKSYNQLSSEGQRVFNDASQRAANGEDLTAPATDYPIDTTLAVINFYPIYGKLNFFDLGVSQFDIYTLLGYGQVRLATGSTSTFTAGGGMAIWLAQHVSSRLEVRYQNYQDKIYSGSRSLNMMVISAGLGFLL